MLIEQVGWSSKGQQQNWQECRGANGNHSGGPSLFNSRVVDPGITFHECSDGILYEFPSKF
jgi:hypothetical protein